MRNTSKASFKNNMPTVLPAEVRYDKRLSYGAKVIYAEMSGLANTKGATSVPVNFLQQCFGENEETIQAFVQELVENGFLKSEEEADWRFLPPIGKDFTYEEHMPNTEVSAGESMKNQLIEKIIELLKNPTSENVRLADVYLTCVRGIFHADGLAEYENKRK